MSHVRLIALTEAERRKFIEEEVANYADQQIRDAGWAPDEALRRAQAKLVPTLERELDEAPERGHQLWSAVRADGQSVGWLWVERIDDDRIQSVFLYQITVASIHRRQGYGHAMLRALEDTLTRNGVEELRLNVNIANAPARRMYAKAGYEQVGEDDRVYRLRKRLGPPG